MASLVSNTHPRQLVLQSDPVISDHVRGDCGSWGQSPFSTKHNYYSYHRQMDLTTALGSLLFDGTISNMGTSCLESFFATKPIQSDIGPTQNSYPRRKAYTDPSHCNLGSVMCSWVCLVHCFQTNCIHSRAT